MEVDNRDTAGVWDLRPESIPADLTTAADQATFLGLTDGSPVGNAASPTTELVRPETPNAVALKTGTASEQMKLWCFDHLGRPLDPGAVANWWTFMATPGSTPDTWDTSGRTAMRHR